jgi:hypothetical protein
MGRCKRWIGQGVDFDKKGKVIMIPILCDGEIIVTVISESPKIVDCKCDRCNNGWRVRNGFKYPK